MHSIIPLLIGWGLDLCTGDPARLPHPIVAFGRWISFFERKANHGNHRRAKGTFWTIATLCTLFLSAHLALATLWAACLQWEIWGTYLYYLVTGILIFYCLAGTTGKCAGYSEPPTVLWKKEGGK
jgi:adenosylcobinamide-phosphate synthase